MSAELEFWCPTRNAPSGRGGVCMVAAEDGVLHTPRNLGDIVALPDIIISPAAPRQSAQTQRLHSLARHWYKMSASCDKAAGIQRELKNDFKAGHYHGKSVAWASAARLLERELA